ncbi:MAG: hypothetical protein AAGC55_02335 [Myxococcota bacterium]
MVRTAATQLVTKRAAHLRFERLLAQAMIARDPVAAMRAIADDASLPEELRQAAAAADPRGVEMTALLVARLRFERLIQGSIEAASWFEREPDQFAAAFREYHQTVAPVVFFPADEGRLFADWLRGRGGARNLMHYRMSAQHDQTR